jgi:hypothetical protein
VAGIEKQGRSDRSAGPPLRMRRGRGPEGDQPQSPAVAARPRSPWRQCGYSAAAARADTPRRRPREQPGARRPWPIPSSATGWRKEPRTDVASGTVRCGIWVRFDRGRGAGSMAGETWICASAPFPKFVIHGGTLGHELRKQSGTSKYMILVPLFDLTFLNERAAGGAGTSNRRH